MKKLLIIFSAVILIIFIDCSDSIVEPKPFGEGDDYLIYETVLKDKLSGEDLLIVLNDSTQSERFDSNSVKFYSEKIPEISPGVFDHYIEINKHSIGLKRIHGISFVFRSEFNNNNKKKVNVVLSRVGYNISKTQAIVTMGAIYAPLAGSGSLIYLEKIEGRWQIRKSIMTWIA